MPSVESMQPQLAVPAAPPVPSRFRSRLLVESGYALTGFPVALVAFVLVVSLFAVGIGTFILGVGVLVLLGAVYLSRGFAFVERRRIGAVLGVEVPPVVYRRAGRKSRKRLLVPLADGQTWLDLGHVVVGLPLAIISWAFTFTWWVGALGGTLYFAYDWALPHQPQNEELHELLGLEDTTTTRILFNTAIGLVFLVTLPLVVRVVARIQASVAYTMLAGVGAMRARIAGLEEDRAQARAQTVAATSAEATALRKLERDIHDGPQQRLVRLAMDLGRAQHQLASDPNAAAATVAEALAQTRETLDELRALSRGIAPPILADRGLAAALAALAGRSNVPVDLETVEVGRLDPALENAAYFVVAEALTNVSKHSGATECIVWLKLTAGAVTITVADNGTGGAHLSKGHGLAGLADRVQAAGGTLRVDSPPGAGTTITAELPVT